MPRRSAPQSEKRRGTLAAAVAVPTSSTSTSRRSRRGRGGGGGAGIVPIVMREVAWRMSRLLGGAGGIHNQAQPSIYAHYQKKTLIEASLKTVASATRVFFFLRWGSLEGVNLGQLIDSGSIPGRNVSHYHILTAISAPRKQGEVDRRALY